MRNNILHPLPWTAIWQYKFTHLPPPIPKTYLSRIRTSFFKDFPKYNMISYHNAILKYIPEENLKFTDEKTFLKFFRFIFFIDPIDVLI